MPRTDAPLPDLDPRIAGATVIIVDDVLYTGRTVRAAIEAIFTEDAPSAYSWLYWSIAVTANCRCGRIISAKTCLPRVMNAFLSA